MTIALKQQLDESLRDAMLAYCLHHVIANDATAANLDIKTAQDLYDYWLLDVLISRDVPTTAVACATSSLQQYINRILMNLEPGYDSVASMPELTRAWQDELHQYSTWAAHQRLEYFPSTYLNPDLRTNKSDNFRQLENDLSQNRIQPDAVQACVLAYLTRFEAITNLNILNGYIDGEKFAESTYYLVGKSRSENSYFWCSLNMAARPLVMDSSTPAAPQPRQDQPVPYAWSQWQKADIPIPENAIEHTIRPVWFNNRLFIVWAELIFQNSAQAGASLSGNSATPPKNPLARLNFCFRRHDGNWSAVRTPIEDHIEIGSLVDKSPVSLKKLTDTVAINHKENNQDFLFISLQVKSGNNNNVTHLLGTDRYMDKNLSIYLDLSQTENTQQKLFLTNQIKKFTEKTDSRLFQHTTRASEKFKVNYGATYLSPRASSQIRKLQNHILLPKEQFVEDSLNLDFRFAALPEEILGLTSRTLSIKFADADLTLVIPHTLPSTPFMPLLRGSSLKHPKLISGALYVLALERAWEVNDTESTNLRFALKDRINSLNFTFANDGDLENKLISTLALKALIGFADRNNPGQVVIYSRDREARIVGAPAHTTLRSSRLNVEFVVAESSTDTPSDFTETIKAIPPPLSGQSSFNYSWKTSQLTSKPTFIFYGFKVSSLDTEDGFPVFICKTIELTENTTKNIPPAIKTTPDLNGAQYIDFSGSAIARSDDDQQARQPIRLTTTFAAELIKRSENSLDELFSLDTQQLSEPAINDETRQTLDFHGPYGRYFTELFLYLPWLVAHRLNAEEQYDAAHRWLGHVFSPRHRLADCWRAIPLLDAHASATYSVQAPHDPHQIALSHPVHFRKALYFLYLDILINRGDSAFRERTPDSLAQAKLWYMQTLELLGQRPAVELVDQWKPVSLPKLSQAGNAKLRRFESLLDNVAGNEIQPTEDIPSASTPSVDNPRWRIPFHPHLLRRWDIVESRLHNLRHNLDIAGRPLHLPLYAPPSDPRGLLTVRAYASAVSDKTGRQAVQIPHYRFSAMYGQALNAVETVIQSGAMLLSLIERREQAQLQEMQQEQLWRLAGTAVDLHNQTLQADRANREALLASKAIVQKRLEHYRQLLEQNVNAHESAAGELYLQSGTFEELASASQAVAGGIMLLPNIAGTSFGGCRFEGTAHAASALMQAGASNARTQAGQRDRSAQFQRRREEWLLAREQAELEISQIDKQLQYLGEVETGTRLQLRQAETTLSQARAVHEFLGKRFSNAQMYQWLNSQFSAMFFQAFDATLALCQETEACWRYETADFDTGFFQRGVWNASCRGFGAGEQLKVSLLHMQSAYVQRHQRDLEIRKTLSLRTLKQQDSNSTTNKVWDEIAKSLKSGVCDFELTQAMFDSDYKGQNHYLRRIKTLSISLPAVLGPYENVRATLTQTSSQVHLDTTMTPQIIEGRRANQQIALSGGVDDSGMFTLNFNDERYLPFEYTGAISTWRLTFPNPQAQQQLLTSLNDIIVHLCYTARAGAA
ncbi:neuraminidase-like domain-containing protein [Pseudomonas serboccidentalis]|uniref:Neuraminidase-like domain-containing protein n=1 Tax=Pseudomonas serboccidentalis TaxID=2964670 RepID=A0ABY7Z916_9PSED|nr:neuraminidase-like domain-containing protein [Pseudomonas serboccidentalis]WDR36178.1 neuraminidase-like domain-containing protein [Pseudomonas serboccidentalis]